MTQQKPTVVESRVERAEKGERAVVEGGEKGMAATVTTATTNLRELLAQGISENDIAQIMVKVIDKIQEENKKGEFLLYTPDDIFLTEFSTANLGLLKVKLGDPIDKKDEESKIYLSPEVLRG